MFERFTEKARRTIFFARYEASQYGSPEITTEHLLLGLIREDRRVFEAVFKDLDQLVPIEEELRSREASRAKEKIATDIDLPLSNAAKRSLTYAAEEADRRSDRHIGTEHLLMSLLREPDCEASNILSKHGVKLEALRGTPNEDSLYASRRFNTYRKPSTQDLATGIPVEFINGASQELIATSSTSAIVPSVGEEVVFRVEGEARVFRVLNVAYVMDEVKTTTVPWVRPARIVVTLESMAKRV